MNVPTDLRYAPNHEWARPTDDDSVTVGISDFAQDQLGDIVFVDLPEAGTPVTAGEPFGEIESTKSVADLYSPVSGVVTAINESLADAPERINSDPYGEGWMMVVRLADGATLDHLMDSAAYEASLD